MLIKLWITIRNTDITHTPKNPNTGHIGGYIIVLNQTKHGEWFSCSQVYKDDIINSKQVLDILGYTPMMASTNGLLTMPPPCRTFTWRIRRWCTSWDRWPWPVCPTLYHHWHTDIKTSIPVTWCCTFGPRTVEQICSPAGSSPAGFY